MSRNINPIKPDEVSSKKEDLIPDEVIDAFNECIISEWNGRSSLFRQDEVIKVIMKKLDAAFPEKNYTRQNVFDNRWLDVEDIFRAEGWKVEYDKPAYCEIYAATFEFSK